MMGAGKPAETSRNNQQSFEVISTLIVCLMMTCVGVSITQVGQKMIAGWNIMVLPIIAFLAALERLLTYKTIKRLVIFSKAWFIYQVTQWVVLLVVIKLSLMVASPPESWWMEIQLWRMDFFGNFFDTRFSYSLIFIIGIWSLTGYFGSLLNEMSLDEALIRYESAAIAPVEGKPARERLLSAIFSLGLTLVVATAMSRVNLRLLLKVSEGEGELIQPLPFLAAGSWNVLLFFILGLCLMSLSQFARLNARWSFQKVVVHPKLAGSWAVYSIGFLLLLALVISVLPTSYSLGLLSSISQVIAVIFSFIVYVIGFLLSILVFLIGFLAGLLGLRTLDQGVQPPVEFKAPEIPTEVIATGTNPWWDLIKSVIFWLVLLSLLGFSFYSFARQQREFLQSLRGFRFFSWLVDVWNALKRMLMGFNKQVSAVIKSGLERIRPGRIAPPAKGIGRPFQIRKLDNRQRVLSTFFHLIRLSDRKGVSRGKSQTPHEFAQKLEDSIPEKDEEITGVTAAFITARYSTREMDDDGVNLVRRHWTKIRSALNNLKI